jgi:hypothetical protein
MKIGPIIHQLIACHRLVLDTPERIVWTLGAILLEMLARLQGYSDYRQKREHHIWQRVDSTKELKVERGYVAGFRSERCHMSPHP